MTWNIFTLYCVIKEIHVLKWFWSWNHLICYILLLCCCCCFLTDVLLINNLYSVQITSCLHVQGFRHLMNWTNTKIALTHTHTHKEKQRLGWSVLVFTFWFLHICISCLLICWLLFSFLYFDKGAFCSQTFQHPVVVFFAHVYTWRNLKGQFRCFG